MSQTLEGPQFHIVTLFPEVFHQWLHTSILGRAYENKVFEFKTYSLRDFTTDVHHTVDDVAYGGGGGMVLKVEPLVKAVESIQNSHPNKKFKVICFTPQGDPITTSLLEDLREVHDESEYILICGHYEGIDQRFLDHWVDLEISLGDFIVTGGEIPALAFLDGFIRFFGGTFKRSTTLHEESFSIKGVKGERLLEYPHYTRPREFQGHLVPDVLLSGDHGAIESWRREQALKTTQNLRPDLLSQ